jgi:hypothetical protein
MSGDLASTFAKMDAHIAHTDAFKCYVNQRVEVAEKVYSKLRAYRNRTDFMMIIVLFLILNFLKNILV